MPCGEIILVSYGEENIVLSENPQITFFKIIYRRYTNFSIETIKTNFLYDAKFGKKYTVEISKIGDLLNKMWLVLELPEIPVVYNFNNSVDEKIKFKWTRKLAYAIIDYVEIEIGSQIISRQYGEWLNVLEELNWNNFNGSLDEYIGNTPDLTTYKFLKNNFNSKTLYVPLFFWFCNNSGASLPLLCLEYNTIRLNIQLNQFENCGIFSPSNYVRISNYFGNGILSEPLVQYSSQGVAWGEFDSIEIGEYDKTTMNVKNYILYYRKISDNEFISSANFITDILEILSSNTISSSSLTTNNNETTNSTTQTNQTASTSSTSTSTSTQTSINSSKSSTFYNYIIYGLYSGSIYIPVRSNPNDPNSIFIQQTYNFIFPSNLVFKNMYLLLNYIYLDREERKKFYLNKHEYTIEQVYYSNPKYLNNLTNRIFIESINPCKFFVFMAQVKYFLNYNVCENFNYNLYFFDTTQIKNKDYFNKNNVSYSNNKPVVKNVYFSLNSNPSIENYDMKLYSVLEPFLNYPMAKNNSGFGLTSFSLYPDTLQPSGSCNMSYFNSFEVNSVFYPIDINYNQYVFKGYSINYNFLKIVNGVAATIFNSAY